jgi:hypothetical protein
VRTALENRLARLEKAARPRRDSIDLIYRRIASVDGNKAIVRAKIDDRILQRNEDESEDAFVHRAKAEALVSTATRPRRLILLPEGIQG